MDGTGKLFEPLMGFIPSNIETEIITLSNLKGDNIKSQTEEIAKRIGKQEVVIFAESYSGPIAYELTQISQANIKRIIFAASFLSRPSYISKFYFLAPLSLLRLKLIPSIFLSWLFFGSFKRNDLVTLFMQALKLVSNGTLRERLKAISSLTEPSNQLEVPCTYIQATKDKLVSSKSINVFKKLCVDLQIKQISGGHFIAQSNPKTCAEVIISALEQQKY